MQVPSSPGFTAMNQRPVEFISPPQSLAIPQKQQNQTKAWTTGKSCHLRNSVVVSSLSLSVSDECVHLLKYIPTIDDQLLQRPVQKRQVQHHWEKSTTRKRMITDSKKAPMQRYVSDALRVTKSLSQSTIHKLDGSIEEPLPTPAPTTLPEVVVSAAKQHHTFGEGEVTGNVALKSNRTLDSQRSDVTATFSDDEDFGQLYFDFETDAHVFDDSAKTWYTTVPHQDTDRHVNEADFDEDLIDDDLLNIAMDTVDGYSSFKLQSSSPTKTQPADEPAQYTPPSGTSAHSPVITDEENYISGRRLKNFVSPVTLTTRLMAATADEAHKPIVRPAFPAAVRDRSPIIGLSSNTLLRTCFRVGEAINQSCQAVKTGHNILIELYARVLNCERDDSQQRFIFCDLFHAKPPYIQGVYAAAIWKSAQLFKYDSDRLLQQGKICRCIGTMKRNGKDWIMTLLNIWEATWDDVQWVEGIVNS